MQWIKIWRDNMKGQTGHLPHIVKDVTEKLKLNSDVALLDVGCGSGSLMEKLPARTRIGLDPSDTLRLSGVARGLDIRKGVAWTLPFPDASFDRVLFYSVIHYMTREQADMALAEMKRVCKPGGWILVGDIGDVDTYRLGSIFYDLVREPAMSILNKTRATYFPKKWFEKRGFAISVSANSNKRFDALFEKK